MHGTGMETTFKLLRDTVDALVALKMDIQCTESTSDDRVVLTGARARRACSDIDQSIDQIRAAMARLAADREPGGN